MNYALCETKVGWAGIGIDKRAICAVEIAPTRRGVLEALADRGIAEPAPAGEAAPLVDLVRRAAGGEPVRANGRLRLVGGTPFQRSVWEAILAIPHGATISYAELARRVGRPEAARAVGQAVGANPIPLLIPCHRVVASNGGLGGFGGGLPMKKALLRQEGVAV
ncbi:MAG: methylated-DNA--[protein]-cysteine S-methyltransferase [Dehalococcoidia bacterium]|nr:methylated-DNA--[protein]-cysteine S-methyltransferase [Dehalococcoidia bacterium]